MCMGLDGLLHAERCSYFDALLRPKKSYLIMPLSRQARESMTECVNQGISMLAAVTFEGSRISTLRPKMS